MIAEHEFFDQISTNTMILINACKPEHFWVMTK